MIKKITVKNPNNLPTTSYKNLKDLQGDLKTISKDNLEKLKQSILKYGIFVPKFVWIENNKNYWIEDGHQTIKALVALEKEGYIIPDIPYVKVECENKKDAAEKLLQINSRYGIINPETTFFEDFNIDLDFINDIEIPELDIKLEELEPEIVEDEVPEPPTEPLSKTGDLWLCGKHKILVGDATKEADILKLMDGKKADMMLIDPPYGIGRDKGFGGFGGFGEPIARRQYIDEWDNKRPTKDTFKLIISKTKNIFIFGGNFFTDLLPVSTYWIVWDKLNTMPTFGDCELIWTNLNRKSVKKITFEYNGLIGKEKERFHPTQKPVGLYADILNDYSKENDLIADFFLGSGTTLIAAHQTGRICYGCEIDPHYIDVILDRYAKFTGDDPIRESDGVKWSELKSSSEKQTD